MKPSPLITEVARALRGLGGPSAGATVVAGLSGGADSVALLDALVELGARQGFRVVAAHLDHALRPDSRDDAAFCGELCRRLEVPLRTAVADVASRARRERRGIEDAGRRERYAFLRTAKEQEGAVVIAVAHTRDDQAETLLLRLLRGAGGAGLAAMRPRAGDVIRPLLGVSRETVLAHLRRRGLPWREDPSNADLSFLRNRVRRELIPYLVSHINPAAPAVLARAAAIAADEAEVLEQLGRELAERVGRREGEAAVLSRSGLAAAPRALSRLAVRHWLREAGGLGVIAAVHVQRILELAASARSSGRRLPLPGGREAWVRFDEIRIGPRVKAAAAFAYPLEVPGRVELPGGLTIVARPGAGSPFGDRPAASKGASAVVPAPGESGPLVVRTRCPGDRVRRRGREVSLKRFLIETRIPVDIRGGLPLVAAGTRVLWIPGRTDVEAVPRAGEGWVRLELVGARAEGPELAPAGAAAS